MDQQDILALQTLPEDNEEALGNVAEIGGHTSYFSIASDCTITVN